MEKPSQKPGLSNQQWVDIAMFASRPNLIFALIYTLDAVGSWQIILPMPKSERAY